MIKWGKVKEIVDYQNKMKDDGFHDLQFELFGDRVLPIDRSNGDVQASTTIRDIRHGCGMDMSPV